MNTELGVHRAELADHRGWNAQSASPQPCTAHVLSATIAGARGQMRAVVGQIKQARVMLVSPSDFQMRGTVCLGRHP